MKIAIVAPSPVPFTIGGAENLMWGLCDAINQKTTHQAELIKLPSKELCFWDLIENYHNFYRLDLTHFDMVISSKYPSWMVQHPNSICYVMHTLRGLYDMYDRDETVMKGVKPIDDIMDYMRMNPDPNNLDIFFAKVFALKIAEIPVEYYDFPGAFIRALVRYMDHFGMSQKGMKSYFAISETVRRRKDYFPEGVKVTAIYPPIGLKKCTSKAYDYIFMISRLDAPKRIDFLISAMQYVTSNVKLLIAGTGSEEQRLKEMAHGDDRIHFLGFVRDEEVEEYYANALVIPYFPYDEDYGYITIEAMMHKKPVITTLDAGGPTEFVKNGETGFVVNLDSKQIAERIDFFARNRDVAREMGEKGYERVCNITWENALKMLLPEGEAKTVHSRRKKMTVLSTFEIYPPQGGGQIRVFNLYKQIAKQVDVDIISYTWDGQPYFEGFIAPGMREIRVPRTREHQRKEVGMGKDVEIPIGDIAMISLGGETPLYKEKLKESIEKSDIVVLSHPYLYNVAKEVITNQFIIYEAQDVEYIIKKEMLLGSVHAEEFLNQVYDIERECSQRSDLIMTCSQEDKEKIIDIYDVDNSKIIVVPNGVDCQNTYFTPVGARKHLKKSLGLENEKIGIFIGSWHTPNLEAAERIIEFAPRCTETKFLLMGSQCDYFKDKKLPENVGLLGMVDEGTKNRIFAAVDFALNPMTSGSGTNLKIFDYLSAGIPVITTEFGTRGTDLKDIFIISEIENMPEVIRDFSLDSMENLVNQGRKYVEGNFDWSIISKRVIEFLKDNETEIMNSEL